MDNLVFEIGLALALIAGATVLSARLRFSNVPLLILVGMAVGPHMPSVGMLDLRFIESRPTLEFMGRLGILFLLFYLGLEFSVGRLLNARRSIAAGGLVYMAINLPLGLLFGWLLGWPFKEVLVVAGIMTISSSAIVAKILVDLKRTANPETEMILGLMMFQDVFVALYLSILSGLILSGATSLFGTVLSTALALGFILGFIILGRKSVPLLNRLLNITSDEVFLLVLLAGLLLIAGLSESIHLAEAVGALLVGLVLAETDHRRRIELLIIPFRDFAGAMFFFSFGLSIDPLALGGAVWITLAAVGLTLIGNIAAGMLSGRKAGLSPKASLNMGLTITSRGEFSIVLAGLAGSGGLLPIVQPFAALYVLILAVVGPLLTRESKHIYTGLQTGFQKIFGRS